MRLLAPVVVSACALTAVVATALAGPAGADDTPVNTGTLATVDLTGFADLVVDQVHGRLFISQGNGTLVVADLDGAPVATVAVPRATNLVLDDAGETLYAALPDAHAIAAVDTTTLGVRTLPLGTYACPGSLAFTTGQVVFADLSGVGGTRCGDNATLGLLDPTDGSIVAAPTRAYSRPVLAASPASPGTVVMGGVGASPSSFHALSVTGGEAPSLVVTTTVRDESSTNLRDLALNPDGTTFVAVHGNQTQVRSVADLTPTGSYPTTGRGTAVAVRPDGLVAAGFEGAIDADLFEAGADHASEVVSVAGGNTVRPGGLAFGLDRLYAVTAGGTSANPRDFALHVVVPGEGVVPTPTPTPTPPPTPTEPVDSQVVLTVPATVTAGSRIPVLVRVDTPESRPLVKLYAIRDDVYVLLTSGRAGADGSWRTSVPAVHTEPLAAVYGGNAGVETSMDQQTVAVRAVVGATLLRPLRSEKGVGVYRLTAPLTVRASVAPSHAGDCVYFRTQVKKGGGWGKSLTSDCFRLGRRSTFDVAIRLRGLRVGSVARVQAGFGGDADNLSGVSPWRQARFVKR